MNENLEIIKLTKKSLKEAIGQNQFWRGKHVAPFSKSKAEWLISSPRIKDNDYLGVLGIEGQEMVALLLMIPDFLNTRNEELRKVYWVIRWWIAPKYKDTILGTYIYREGSTLSNNRILIKAYAENTKDFYEQQPLVTIASRLRHTIFFGLDTSILQGRFSVLKPFTPIIGLLNKLVKGSVMYLNKIKAKKRTQSLKYEYLNQLDEATWLFLEPCFEKDLILKTKDYVNWQINPQQYTQTPLDSKMVYSNLQTGMSSNIYIHNVKILFEQELIGFMSFILNHNEFNIKYFVAKDQIHYDLCIDALMEHLVRSNKNFMFTDDTKLSDNITKRYKTLFTYRINKKGLAHNENTFDFEKVELLNRDGHFY